MKKIIAGLLVLCCLGCEPAMTPTTETEVSTAAAEEISQTSLVILGNVQDAGSPHIACKKSCCRSLFEHPDPSRKVVSLGLIDPTSETKYLFEATPDISEQLKMMKQMAPAISSEVPDGIFNKSQQCFYT